MLWLMAFGLVALELTALAAPAHAEEASDERLPATGDAAPAASHPTATSAEALPSTPPDPRTEIAFREGKKFLAAGDYAQACPLLAESYWLEPATGSLLALAMCHEGQGRYASALKEYDEVARRARLEDRSDRLRVALSRHARLLPRVSQLVLHVSKADTGGPERVSINGVALTEEERDEPIFVDGGSILVEASQTDRKPFSGRVFVAPQRDYVELTVPELEPVAIAAPAPASRPVHVAGPTRRTRSTQEREKKHLKRERLAGIALMGAGAVSGAFALGYTLRALQKKSDSDHGCIDDVCTPEGTQDRQAARRAGNIATATLAAAAGLSAVGIGLFVHARRSDRRSAAARLKASAWAARGEAGVVLRGGF